MRACLTPAGERSMPGWPRRSSAGRARTRTWSASALAVHFERGGLPDPAFRYARRAGDMAHDRYANVDAADLYGGPWPAPRLSRAIAPADVASVAEARGDVAELAGRYDKSLAGYARARGLRRLLATSPAPQAVGGPEAALVQAQLARKTGIVCERAGRYGRALAWYTRGQHRLDGGAGRRRRVAAHPAHARSGRDPLSPGSLGRLRPGLYSGCGHRGPGR